MPSRSQPDAEFRRFAVRYAPTLLHAARLLLRNVDLAEDAVQLTMLQLFRNWDNARIAPEPYSRQVLINVCRDHWRRQARRPIEVHEDQISDEPQAESFATAVERRELVVNALAEIPVLQREVLVLRYLLDLSLEDTANALQISEGTVKSATHRGLARLRDLLSSSTEAETC